MLSKILSWFKKPKETEKHWFDDNSDEDKPYVLVTPCYECPGQGGCTCTLPLIKVHKSEYRNSICKRGELTEEEAKKYHDLDWLREQ